METVETAHKTNQLSQSSQTDGVRLSKYLPEFVYWWIDGIITTFAVVAWSTWASLDISIILILWFANLFADGLSMSVGSYLSTKSEHEEYFKHLATEKRGIKNHPKLQKEKILTIYAEKWFSGELLEETAEKITNDTATRAREIVQRETWQAEPTSSPMLNGVMTLISFILVWLLPLLSYLFAAFGRIWGDLFVTAIIITWIWFIGIWWLKSAVNESNLMRSILETLALGIVAALVAYYVGDVLESIIV